LNILPPQARIKGGGILFNGLDLLAVDDETMRGLRGSKISMVFQEPASAMNPVFTAGEQMVEAVLSHRQVSKRTAKEIAVEYFKKAHIADPLRVFHDYPHRLSGGMRQRVMIAMALVNSPELVILDEPTTALDVTIQARILGLLAEIISGERLSALFISHDFGIVENMCDDVAVMRGGRIVEKGPAGQILKAPQDPYTVSLLEAVKALS
jgi:ABC-type dipeptide/oligopeptide/nickel transport system ATPase component